jgi:hypothetical protein
MARDSGNTLLSARSLNLATGPKTRRETIGGTNDPRDFFKFSLSSRSSFDLSLKKLRSNVDVTLLDSARKVIAFSRQPGRKPELIKTTLDTGTFYIRLNAKESSTGYELKVAATPLPVPPPPANTAPTIATNTPLTVSRNGTGTIGRTNLLSTDTQQTADQLLYRVTSLPASGSLFLNGTLLGVGSAFTQTDIDNNRLTYKQNSVKTISSTGGIAAGDPPKISGSNVVWAAQDSTGDTEIFLYRGSMGAVTQLTNNAVDDRDPEIFGSNVVWQSDTGTNAEIYLYNGTTGVTTQLSNNSVEDRNAKISDGYVVWQRQISASHHDIRYYRLSDGLSGTVDPSATFDDTDPAISGSKVVFRRDDTAATVSDGIYFVDLASGTGETQVSFGNSTYTDRRPQISGSTVVWERDFTDGNRDIRYDSDLLVPGSQVIDSSPTLIDEQPLISGNHIVFERTGTPGSTQDGGYVFNISTGTVNRFISASSYSINSIDGNLVGWTTGGGGATANLYNIATGTAQVLDGGVSLQGLVSVSGPNAAWLGASGPSVVDRLFFYDGSIVADSFGFSVSDGSLTTNGTFNFTIG